jgi:hypothetical protein
VQCDPQGSTAKHERKRRRKQKQGDPLRIDHWSRLKSVFGAHHETTNDSASNAVMATSTTMITSSEFFDAGFMAKGAGKICGAGMRAARCDKSTTIWFDVSRQNFRKSRHDSVGGMLEFAGLR